MFANFSEIRNFLQNFAEFYRNLEILKNAENAILDAKNYDNFATIWWKFDKKRLLNFPPFPPACLSGPLCATHLDQLVPQVY